MGKYLKKIEKTIKICEKDGIIKNIQNKIIYKKKY